VIKAGGPHSDMETVTTSLDSEDTTIAAPPEEMPRWGLPALLGVLGSALLAIGSDLPGSPFGPHAGGLWPFAATGAAPSWEGPALPAWAMVANQGPGVTPGRLLPTAAVIVGLGLLVAAWLSMWRRSRRQGTWRLRHLASVVGAWTVPLLFAAPLATQDVWAYGAEGRLVLAGHGGYRPASALGHSLWTQGVDIKWIAHPSPYGPGALDLSALFVRISGGHPWVAAEWWRVTAIVGLTLCLWGTGRLASHHGGNGVGAAMAAINPLVVVILVGGIHNDGLMLGLAVAAVALSIAARQWEGALLCAAAVAVKPNALLALGALAWWTWGRNRTDRLRAVVVTGVALVGVLVVSGLAVGGGFAWLSTGLVSGGIAGPWSIGAELTGSSTGWFVESVAVGGCVGAVALVLWSRARLGWMVGLGWGFAALAVSSPRPEPWYLTWAVVFLACGGLERRTGRLGIVVLTAMIAGSLLPLGVMWWFEGLIVLVALGVKASHSPPAEVAKIPSPSTPVLSGIAG
jgi:alpha-1,6-mannosyltransferase